MKNVKHTVTLNLYLYTCHLHSAGNNFLYLLYHVSPFLNPPSNPFYFWMHFKVNSILQCKFHYTDPLNTSICISLTRDHILFSFFFFFGQIYTTVQCTSVKLQNITIAPESSLCSFPILTLTQQQPLF